MTTNVVTTCKNEDTKEATWHQGCRHFRIKNLEWLKKEHLEEGLDYNVSKKRMQPCIGGKQHQTLFS